VAAALAGRAGRVADDPARAIGAAALVVNATSVGMGAPAEGPAAPEHLPFDPTLVRPGQVVVDIVYQPLRTPLLRASAVRGATTVDGVGMLVHQAALAAGHWLGVAAPVAPMRAAAEAALAGR
jgi:shikimate dehydrogenase